MSAFRDFLKTILILTLIYPIFIVVFSILSLYNKSGAFDTQTADASKPMFKAFFDIIYSLPVFVVCVVISILIIFSLLKKR